MPAPTGVPRCRTNSQDRDSPPSAPSTLQRAGAAAFVYGNVLVLAALIALDPPDLLTSRGLFYVLGTGVSTYVAQTFAELVGHRIRDGAQLNPLRLREVLRDASPIAVSAAAPAALLVGAWAGWVEGWIALAAAQVFVVVRLALLGWTVGRAQGSKRSRRKFWAGISLAASCACVALFKWWLTH